MGHVIEINDTLKLTRDAGFPQNPHLGSRYSFTVSGRRLYNLSPTRVFLVEEVEGTWNYVGHALILEQTIDTLRDETRGIFEVSLLYPRQYVESVNTFEPPVGRTYHPHPKPSA